MTALRLRNLADAGLDPGLPTWSLVDFPDAHNCVVVDVPEGDLPPDPVHRALVTAPGWERAAAPAALVELTYVLWYEHLDDRYREHAGRFRPRLP